MSEEGTARLAKLREEISGLAWKELKLYAEGIGMHQQQILEAEGRRPSGLAKAARSINIFTKAADALEHEEIEFHH